MMKTTNQLQRDFFVCLFKQDILNTKQFQNYSVIPEKNILAE